MRQLPPVLAVAAAVLLLPSAAAAAPTPGATYGGGTIPTSVKESLDSAVVTAAVAPDGSSVKVVANTALDCGKGRVAVQQLVGSGSPGPDGRVRFDAKTRRYEFNIKGAKPRGTGSVDIGFEGATGSGTIRMVTKRGGRTCDSTLPVQLRVAGDDSSPAGAATPGAFYFGNGSASWQGVSVPFGLHVGGGGSRVSFIAAGAPLRCKGYTDYLVNFSAPTRIREGGRFSRRERFSTRFKGGASNRTVFKLDGRFTEQGVRGTYSATMKVRVPGRRTATCRTGKVRFTAVR